MPKINAGGATGGSPVGQEVHTDWPGQLEKLPQANGGVQVMSTSKQSARPSEYPMTAEGERDIGNISRDKLGSMNGRSAGETKSMKDIN